MVRRALLVGMWLSIGLGGAQGQDGGLPPPNARPPRQAAPARHAAGVYQGTLEHHGSWRLVDVSYGQGDVPLELTGLDPADAWELLGAAEPRAMVLGAWDDARAVFRVRELRVDHPDPRSGMASARMVFGEVLATLGPDGPRALQADGSALVLEGAVLALLPPASTGQVTLPGWRLRQTFLPPTELVMGEVAEPLNGPVKGPTQGAWMLGVIREAGPAPAPEERFLVVAVPGQVEGAPRWAVDGDRDTVLVSAALGEAPTRVERRAFQVRGLPTTAQTGGLTDRLQEAVKRSRRGSAPDAQSQQQAPSPEDPLGLSPR